MTAQRTFKTRLIDTVNGLDLHETTDLQRSVFATRTGEKDVLASAWGPSANGDGNWFACRLGGDPQRFEDRAAAVSFITATPIEAEVAR
jgi:hypothetical protein